MTLPETSEGSPERSLVITLGGASRSPVRPRPRRLAGRRGLVLTVSAMMVLSAVVAVSFVVANSPIAPGGASDAPASSSPGTVCSAPSRIASALDILQPDPTDALPAGASLEAGYEYEVYNYSVSDLQISVAVPVLEAIFAVSGGATISVTIPAASNSISGSNWSSEASATISVASAQTFSATPQAELITEGYYLSSPISDAVQATAPYGNLTLEFRWQWQLTEPNGTVYVGPWTVPATSPGYPALPSIFFPAPEVISDGVPKNVTMGTNFTDEISGFIANTSFSLSFQNSNGTVLGTEPLTTTANVSSELAVSIPIIAAAHVLAKGYYIFHLTDRCGALVQDVWFQALYPTTANVAVGIHPSACGPILLDGIAQSDGSVAVVAASDSPQTLSAPACSGYAFEEWNSTGGVLTAAPGSNPTTVLVSWSGTLTALYGVPNAATFEETGLATNGTWSVTIGELTLSAGAGSSIAFTLERGTYHYSVGSDEPGLATPEQGGLTFVSTLLVVDITFSPINITHTVVIMLENQDLDTILQYAPYLGYLWNTYGEVTNYYPVCHPSLPNYYAITAGRSGECGLNDGVGIPPSHDEDLPDVLQAAGQTWGGYFESMPRPCDENWTTTIYDPTHNPFLVSDDIYYNTSRCDADVVNSAVFNASVANGTLPNFSFYVPNTQDDCEYAVLQVCNDWLQGFLPPILNSTNPAVENLVNHTAFFILFDEGLTNLGYSVGGIPNSYCSNLTGQPLTACGGHSYLTVVSPYSHRDVYTSDATGFNVAETIEWLLGVGNEGGYDASPYFPPMKSLFEPASSAVYDVTMTEYGLPVGTEWWANLTNGQSIASTSNSITLSEPDGAYAFDAASTDKTFFAAPGNFSVDGSAVFVPVSFSDVSYGVAFTESGLPAGTEWWLNLTNGQTFKTTGSLISFNEPNSTYSYTLDTTLKTYASASGTFAVDGANVSKSVTFSLRTFTVSFQESGLPTGTEWWVDLAAGPSSESSTPQLVLNESNGTFSYSLGTALTSYASPSGSFVVDGANLSVDVAFSLQVFSVSFNEAGLPSGTSWSVTLNGTGNASTGTAIGFSEPNGTYAYVLGTVSGYSPTLAAGNVTVSGASANVTVTFATANSTSNEFPVRFTESGLPSGTLWSVYIAAAESTSEGTSISVLEANGTYAYTVGAVEGFVSIPASGVLTVAGAAVPVELTFRAFTYTVMFTETGLPAGTNWSVTLNGFGSDYILGASSASASLTQWSDGGSSVPFQVSNGTYSYSTFAAGYSSHGSSFRADGSPVTPQTVAFTPSPSSGLPGSLLVEYVIVGVVVLGAAISVVVVWTHRRPTPPPP